MSKNKLYKQLATSGAFVGLGMIIGNSLSEGTTNTALWLGGALILGSAVLFGMSMNDSAPKESDES